MAKRTQPYAKKLPMRLKKIINKTFDKRIQTNANQFYLFVILLTLYKNYEASQNLPRYDLLQNLFVKCQYHFKFMKRI